MNIAVTKQLRRKRSLQKIFSYSIFQDLNAKEHLSENFLFLERGPRKFTFGGKDEALEKRISRKSAEEAFTQRKSGSDKQKAAALKATDDEDFSSSTKFFTTSRRCS